MSMVFLLIKIKIDIDINNDELLEITWNIRKGKKLIDINSAQQWELKFYNDTLDLSFL
jgi:hypothetical protein